MLPGDPNLGHGTNAQHIEIRFGDAPEQPDCEPCDGSGYLPISECCEAEMDARHVKEGVCPTCHQLCDRIDCGDCDGSGKQPEEERNEPEPDRDE